MLSSFEAKSSRHEAILDEAMGVKAIVVDARERLPFSVEVCSCRRHIGVGVPPADGDLHVPIVVVGADGVAVVVADALL